MYAKDEQTTNCQGDVEYKRSGPVKIVNIARAARLLSINYRSTLLPNHMLWYFRRQRVRQLRICSRKMYVHQQTAHYHFPQQRIGDLLFPIINQHFIVDKASRFGRIP